MRSSFARCDALHASLRGEEGFWRRTGAAEPQQGHIFQLEHRYQARDRSSALLLESLLSREAAARPPAHADSRGSGFSPQRGGRSAPARPTRPASSASVKTNAPSRRCARGSFILSGDLSEGCSGKRRLRSSGFVKLRDKDDNSAANGHKTPVFSTFRTQILLTQAVVNAQALPYCRETPPGFHSETHLGLNSR